MTYYIVTLGSVTYYIVTLGSVTYYIVTLGSVTAKHSRNELSHSLPLIGININK